MTPKLSNTVTSAPEPPHAEPIHPRSVPIVAAANETEQEADQPFAEGAGGEIDADLRHRMISETAYHLYVERGYAEGYDIDDWLQAEAAVDHLLLNRKGGTGSAAAA